jgi:DNA-binding response OmpR family regulator
MQTVTLIGAVGSASALLSTACRGVGLVPALTDAVPPPPTASALTLVDATVAGDAPADLPAALRRAGAGLIVLVGPAYGSLGHVMALERGFDEVWDVHSPPELLRVQVRRAAARADRGGGGAALAAEALAAQAWAAPASAAEAQATPAPSDNTPPTPPARWVQAGPFSLDPHSRTLLASGRRFGLWSHTSSLLAELMRCHPGAASRDELAQALGTTPIVAPERSRAVDQVVVRARKNLVALGLEGLDLRAERGFGYRLVIG